MCGHLQSLHKSWSNQGVFRHNWIKSIFTHMASIYKKLLSVQKKRLPKKRVHLRQNWFGTWPPFHCFGTQNNMAAVISCENSPYSLWWYLEAIYALTGAHTMWKHVWQLNLWELQIEFTVFPALSTLRDTSFLLCSSSEVILRELWFSALLKI